MGRDDRGYWLCPIGAGGYDTRHTHDAAAFADAVATIERASRPRWVLDGAALPELLLRHGVRLERCHDLGLVGRILATRGDAAEQAIAAASPPVGAEAAAPPRRADEAPLFDLDAGELIARPGGGGATAAPWGRGVRDAANAVKAVSAADAVRAADVSSTAGAAPDGAGGPSADTLATVERYRHQLERVAGANDRGALRLLAAAESSGRLVAAELGAVGVPFDERLHERILVDALGERGPGGRPGKLEAAAAAVRDALGAPRLNVDSPRDLLAALRAAGITVRSTGQWELLGHVHPVIEPLQHYKRLSRLFTANGWAWRDAWVRDDRMRTGYVPGGVVTGRWATSGGGALQLPREVRGAVVADDGWKLVVADAAQLEPRILAALSDDEHMAEAGQARDLYQAFVDAQVVATRQDAKIGLLGAMYGGTTGRSGELLPALRRAYPRALRFVESAARAGERGEQVATRLGRFSPWPPDDDSPAGGDGGAGGSRAWGRFTRNFVVQGTAAEWALAWLARIRQRLVAGAIVDAPLDSTPHLVYFLHDEVVVHAPAAVAEDVAREVEAAAAWAGRLLFADAPVAFPVSTAIVDAYGDAK